LKLSEGLGKLKLENYKPLRDIVFEYLREAILTGKLEPAQRLMEVQLAEQLGVSRTPVREAIRKLELEGLVVMIPRKGAYVADVSLKDIIEVLEIRTALEGLAASLAAERMTDDEIQKLREVAEEFKQSIKTANVDLMVQKDIEFHEMIFTSTNNQKLVSMNHALREQVYRFRITYISDFDTSETLIKEHKEILDAISKRNPSKAMENAMKHIENAENFMIEKASKNRELFK